MLIKYVKIVLTVFIIIFCLSSVNSFVAHAAGNAPLEIRDLASLRIDGYEDYIRKYEGEPKPNARVIIPAASYKSKLNASTKLQSELEGHSNVIAWDNYEGELKYEINVSEKGLYYIELSYYQIPGKGREIELALEIDGKVPFYEAQTFRFSRVWKDASKVMSDNRGNQYSPVQIEAPEWRTDYFKDAEGKYNRPFEFYFEKGIHTITIKCIRESLAFDAIRLVPIVNFPKYVEVEQEYKTAGYKTYNGTPIKIQAELSATKSSPQLHPIFDISSPLTEPYSPSKIMMNTIGQINWRYPNQWINWEFEVPEDGLYEIALRYRQNMVRGLFTTRRIMIDGKLPFSELETEKFNYDTKWRIQAVGGMKPYQFYLKKGTHTLTMETALGDMAETLRVLEDAVFGLNEMYRKIIMITSTKPDRYFDYYLERVIPELIPAFQKTASTLSAESERLVRLTGNKGSEAVLIDRMSNQLTSLVQNPETIAERLDNFKSNISALAAWILKVKEQPLELDYILVYAPGSKLPRAEANFWEKFVHEGKRFFASFLEDYNTIGNVYSDKKTVTVWIDSGRDQAQIIKNMADEMFTPNNGVTVNVKLVQGALMQAVLAGKGPDIALNVPREQPVNLAMRGALEDLSGYSGFKEVTERFVPTSMVPYEFQGGYFALPNSQTYNMLFYRKDILEDLGLTPPQTWEDFYNIIPIIQRNNMTVGIPSGGAGMQEEIYSIFLLQRGGRFYAEDKRSVALGEPEALEAFKEWTAMYTDYSLPLSYSFYNRFRTGEMPIAIQPYSQYNMLAAAAPEIRNLWGMIPIPGRMLKNGEIDRSQSTTGSANVMIKSAKNKEAAWEFLKWWTSTEAQLRFSRDLESIMGVAARYNTSNIKAFEGLPWSKSELDSLLTSWSYIKDIPELPGSYYMKRNLENAFRTVVYDYENPRETLFKWNRETNNEIQRKRMEFGLDLNSK